MARYKMTQAEAQKKCYVLPKSESRNYDFVHKVISDSVYEMTVAELYITERANFMLMPYSSRNLKWFRQRFLIDKLFDKFMDGWDVFLINGKN